MSFRSASSRSSLPGRAYSQRGSRAGPVESTTTVDYLNDDLLDGQSLSRAFPLPSVSSKPALLSRNAVRVVRQDVGEPRLIIAIDFGTTFTGVAYSLTTGDDAELNNIEIVIDWGNGMNSREKIPSVLSYSLSSNGERQYGADVSDESVTMMNFKLELEVQDKRYDELELTLQALEGACNLSFKHIKQSNSNPEYSYKAPEDIVTDYLTKVCERAWEIIEPTYLYSTRKPPVDIVVTVPVNWSYAATNATFRAVRAAGFNEETIPTLNDMILLSEPEAASHFTVRHLQERKPEFLKPNEPFILADAGGGTVDAIAYQVKQLKPYLELSQVSLPTRDKCGAAYIDTYFKRWLRKAIGHEKYRSLDPTYSGQRTGAHTTESGAMRKVIRDFDVQKKSFSNRSMAVKLDLPEPLSALTTGGSVKEGEVTIQKEEMKTMFDHCVSRVITLIDGQVKQVEKRSRRRIKNVFLVGGFGESKYLQEELEQSLRLRNIKLQTVDRMASWTAVVQGAVVYGIERSRQKSLRLMSMSRKSYGIVIDEPASYMTDEDDVYKHPLTTEKLAREQFAWLVRKGDLVLSDEPKIAEKEFSRTFVASDSRRFDLPVYVYPDEEDDVPDRWATGQHDVETVAVVRCDISNVSPGALQTCWNYASGERYILAQLLCRIKTTLDMLEVEVMVVSGTRDSNNSLIISHKIGHAMVSIAEGALQRRGSTSSGVSELSS